MARRVKHATSDDYADTRLGHQLDAFMAEQMAECSALREAHRARAEGRVKSVLMGRFSIDVHNNPRRIQSTTAQVDSASIQGRPCQLCPEHRLEGQRGLAYGDHLTILCNPFPVLDRHLTIVDSAHVPQALDGRMALMLGLAKDLSGAFVIFYNGPFCGASTPEHFHFQAVPREGVPLITHLAMAEEDSTIRVHRREISVREGVESWTLSDYHVRLIVYRGSDGAALQACVDHTLRQFANLLQVSQEPPVNLLVTFDDPGWTVLLLPRAKHRPQCYFDGTLTVSPASLDMAGCFVVPIPAQFDAVGAAQLTQLFTEVALGHERFGALVHSLSL